MPRRSTTCCCDRRLSARIKLLAGPWLTLRSKRWPGADPTTNDAPDTDNATKHALLVSPTSLGRIDWSVAIPIVELAGGGMTNGIVEGNAVEAQTFD
jgi:hypothetical protein